MTRRTAVSEDARQLVHIAVGGAALLLRYLTWFEATMLGLIAVVFNSFVLHRVGGARLFRPDEHGRWRAKSGIVLYPSSVLALLVLLPSRPDIVAGAWGVLAAGDGMATLVGRHLPIRPLPWNREKSVGGTAAFLLFGSAAAVALLWWCEPRVIPPAFWWFPVVAGITGAVVAAGVESIPIRLDDNVSVAASAAATMWAVSLLNEDLVIEAWRSGGGTFLFALVVNVLVAAAGYAGRTVSLGGSLAGAAIGTTVLAATGWAGWGLLLATFALAVVTSRMGLARKRALRIEEEREGRRGAGNAIANTGIAALAALFSVVTFAHEAALIAFVAALTAGGSDTVASEIGKAWGRRTFLVTNAKKVKPGTPGAMSLEGTLAGIVSAAALAAAAAGVDLVGWDAVLPIALGATVGALIESAMGATFEPRGVVNNDVLNLVNTGVAAYVAVKIWLLL